MSYRPVDGSIIRDNPEPARLISPTERRREQVRKLEEADVRPLVILSREILEKIKAMRNGLEDGAWLVGPSNQSSIRVLEVSRSLWPADQEDRASSKLQVRTAEALQINKALGRNHEVIGHWHTQPDDSLPSDADIDAWRDLRKDLGLDSFIGIVVRERLTGGIDLRTFWIGADEVLQAARIEVR